MTDAVDTIDPDDRYRNLKQYIRNKRRYYALKGKSDKNDKNDKNNINPEPLIIITNPHSVCLNVRQRTCDRLSERFGTKLRQALEYQNIRAVQIKSHQNRYRLDDNRVGARFKPTPFWETLTTTIDQNPIRIILDIHSFPTESFNNEPIVLLANKPFDKFNIVLANVLNAKIGTAKSGSNAIIDYAKGNNILASLIEVNESLVDDQIDRLVKKIVDLVKNIIQK